MQTIVEDISHRKVHLAAEVALSFMSHQQFDIALLLLNCRCSVSIFLALCLKVHYVTFLRAVNQPKTEFLMQETVVCRS